MTRARLAEIREELFRFGQRKWATEMLCYRAAIDLLEGYDALQAYIDKDIDTADNQRQPPEGQKHERR